MKECPNCGELLGDSVEICYACQYHNKWGRVLTMEETRQIRENRQQMIAQQQLKTEERQKNAYNKEQAITDIRNNKIRFLCNMGYNFEGYKITEYLGIVSSEIVLGTGFLSELSLSINDTLGTQVNAYEEKLSLAKNAALENLITMALDKRANAVIGLNYDIFTLTQNTLVVSANATAVYIEK